MAIVKFVTSGCPMNNIFPYVTREEATEERLIDGVNCSPETALEEFQFVKRQFHKEDGRMYYHVIQSFSPDDDLTPETAHEIGLRFAEAFPGYQILVATHVNTGAIHNHLIMNSVSFEDGRKFHQTRDEMLEVKEYSNQLCLEYGLSVTEPKSKGGKRSKAKAELVQTALYAMAVSSCREEFIQYMEEHGYRVKWEDDHKYQLDGRKISKAKTITVPNEIKPRAIPQYVAHEAEEFERYVKNGFGEDANTPFHEYAEKWLARQVKYAPSTIASYRRMLERTYPFIGQISLCKLRPIALENMMNELRQREYRGKRIQEATVQKYLTVVSAVLSDAKRNEVIQKNPARMIDLPMVEDRTQKIPSPQEAQEILSAIYEEPFVYRVYYFLAIYTGCRRGELAALRWADFTMDQEGGAVLTVCHSRSIVAGQGVTEGTTKNRKARQIYIEPEVMEIIRALQYEQSYHEAKHKLPSSEYLFTNEKGEPIHPDTFTKRLRRLYDDCGFPKEFHLHTLRHYFVTSMLHHGVDKQTVAELAGHGDTGFLERTYCHPQMELKQQAAKLMSGDLLSMSVKSESA